jgi:hypothetical protein
MKAFANTHDAFDSTSSMPQFDPNFSANINQSKSYNCPRPLSLQNLEQPKFDFNKKEDYSSDLFGSSTTNTAWSNDASSHNLLMCTRAQVQLKDELQSVPIYFWTPAVNAI